MPKPGSGGTIQSPFPKWTRNDDVFYASIDLIIQSGTKVDTLAGNDSIIALGSVSLTNNGSLLTGRGNDVIDYSNSSGYVSNNSVIDLGIGDDYLRAFDLRNAGTIFLGDGADNLNVFFLLNSGIIRTGPGNDSFSFGTSFGTYNQVNAVIDLGSGSDYFGNGTGTATGSNAGTIIAGLETDADKDYVGSVMYSFANGDPASGAGNGLANLTTGTISTGGGDDTIIGQGTKGYFGIINNGLFSLGAGNDIVTDTLTGELIALGLFGSYAYPSLPALTGYQGMSNTGSIDLGAGNDVVKAYRVSGTGTWQGGEGIDTLSLGEDGTYVISAVAGGYSINGEGLFSSFEQITAWGTSENLSIAIGTYTIGGNASSIRFVPV